MGAQPRLNTIRNLLKTNIPGFEDASTELMKEAVKRNGAASIEALRVEANVRSTGCQMTADLFSWDKAEFHLTVQDWAGCCHLPCFGTKGQGRPFHLIGGQ